MISTVTSETRKLNLGIHVITNVSATDYVLISDDGWALIKQLHVKG